VIADANHDLNERRGSALEQAALRRIATLVAQGVQPQELFAVVAEEVGRVVDAPSVAVARYESDDTATVCGTFPAQGPLFTTGARVPLTGANVLGLIREHAEPARVDDYAELEGEIADAVRSSGIHSSVGVPITVAGRVWGAIVASNTERLPENTGARLAEFTELLASAIADTEAREARAQLADEQAALRRVATLVAQGAAPAEVFTAVSAEVDRVFGLASATFDVAAVGRFDPGPELVVVGVSKSVKVVPPGSRWPLDELFAPTHVLRTGRSARIGEDDLASVGGETAEFLRQHGYLSQVASPIVVDGRLWGAMSVNSSNDFPPDTEERLERFTELVATAIANAGSRETRAHLADEQAALRRVATLIAQGAAPAEVFAAVSSEVDRVFRFDPATFDVAGVVRFEPGPELVVVGVSKSVEAVPLASHFPPDELFAPTHVLRTGRSARIGEGDLASAGGETAEFLRHHGYLSQVASPIVVEGRLWGAISVNSGSDFPADTEERLERFTGLVATAIANAQSRDELEHVAAEQAGLRRVATRVAQGASPRDVVEAVTEEVGRLLPIGSSAMGRFEPDGSVTTMASWSTGEAAFPTGGRWPTEGTNIAWMVLQTGRPARIDDFSAATDPIGVATREAGITSAVGSPVVVEGDLWGFVTAASTEGPLPPGTEARLASFTELVATAIANAKSQNALEELAAEQAALRRVATLVAQGARPAKIFSAVSDEVGRLFDSDQASVGRFDPEEPALVVVGVAQKIEVVTLGTRWELRDSTASARVFRTGRSARVDSPTASLDLQSVVASPIVVEGRLWGTVIVSSSAKPLPADAEQRLEKFTELVATAIANADSHSELAASRRRIVAAADEARRRIERNLHDGTQQRLIALGLDLQRVEATIRAPAAQAEIERAVRDLGSILEDLRELSHGLHPPLLSRAGLRPALGALARRSPIPVQLDVDLPERPPAEVETAIYYVVSEALANAIKHSHASATTVTIAGDPRATTVCATVADDGVGGAEPSGGSGLIGLGDRVHALGGRFVLESPAGLGTRISVELPVEQAVAS
jgi:signal transduction histidine kinase/uncharacterized protein YoaH (UPF0181 family)